MEFISPNAMYPNHDLGVGLPAVKQVGNINKRKLKIRTSIYTNNSSKTLCDSTNVVITRVKFGIFVIQIKLMYACRK